MNVREFERKFNELYLPLGMYAMRITDDADSAEDAVQEAFAKAWTVVSAGAAIADFKAYMYRVVRNVSVDMTRRQPKFVGIELADDVSDLEIDTSERDARIWKAVDNLPDRCREIFLMSKRDGMTNEEIADELGLSVKTVKNQMTKAFVRLREALDSGHKPFFLPFL